MTEIRISARLATASMPGASKARPRATTALPKAIRLTSFGSQASTLATGLTAQVAAKLVKELAAQFVVEID